MLLRKALPTDDHLADALHLHAVVHDYYQIDFDILWDVINKDLPVLKAQVEDYL